MGTVMYSTHLFCKIPCMWNIKQQFQILSSKIIVILFIMKGNGTRLTWWPLLATILYLVNAFHLQGNDLVIKKPRATCVTLGCFPVRAWRGVLSFVVQCVVIHNTPDTTKRSNMWPFGLIKCLLFFPNMHVSQYPKGFLVLQNWNTICILPQIWTYIK